MKLPLTVSALHPVHILPRMSEFAVVYEIRRGDTASPPNQPLASTSSIKPTNDHYLPLTPPLMPTCSASNFLDAVLPSIYRLAISNYHVFLRV